MSRALVRIVEAGRVDTAERIEALRLQAFAWRNLAIIGTHDQVYVKKRALALIMLSVPFVNETALKTFVADTTEYAAECGKKSGVFEP